LEVDLCVTHRLSIDPSLTALYLLLIMCGRITTKFEFSDIRLRWNLDRDLPNLRISGIVEATVADNYYLPLGEMKLII
jgi:hypothetical protein